MCQDARIHLSFVCLTNSAQQDEDDSDQGEGRDQPFKLSKWELAENEHKMGKSANILKKIHSSSIIR